VWGSLVVSGIGLGQTTTTRAKARGGERGGLTSGRVNALKVKFVGWLAGKGRLLEKGAT